MKKFADFGSERERQTGERSGLWAVKTKKRELQRGKLTMGLFFSVCFLLSSSTTSLLCCVCFFLFLIIIIIKRDKRGSPLTFGLLLQNLN